MAIDNYKKAIKINQTNPYVYYNLSCAYLKQGKNNEAKSALIKALTQTALKLGYQPDLDEDLIKETVSFTEHPVVLSGDMDIKFLKLPKELITTVLKKQLRMFPVIDKQGNLQPHFLAVRDQNDFFALFVIGNSNSTANKLVMVFHNIFGDNFNGT